MTKLSLSSTYHDDYVTATSEYATESKAVSLPEVAYLTLGVFGVLDCIFVLLIVIMASILFMRN